MFDGLAPSAARQALENKIQVLLKKVVVRPVHMEVRFLSNVKRIRGSLQQMVLVSHAFPRHKLRMLVLIMV